MDLHPLDVMRDQKRPPTVVNFPAVREEFEVPFDHAGQTICFGDDQLRAEQRLALSRFIEPRGIFQLEYSGLDDAERALRGMVTGVAQPQ